MLLNYIIMSTLRIDDMLITYGDSKYAELALFIDLLRSLSFLHQTHHWQTQGHASYSDHLLFQRLYDKISDQVDKVAEKSVGLSTGNVGLVNYKHSLYNMPKFLNAIEDIADTNIDDPPALKMVKKSLLAEKSFITAGEKLMNILDSKGLLTRGLEQLLGEILDLHENSVYLLKQRNT